MRFVLVFYLASSFAWGVAAQHDLRIKRVDFDFTRLAPPAVSLQAGDVVINEFLALNQNAETDEAGQHDDWLELYNNTSIPISLDGVYLTDKADNPTKWPFPAGTTIAPNGFLIVWCDEDQAQGPLHANFKISGEGEFLMLSNGAGGVIDSISFGPQKVDTTFGRYPNGTGDFTFMPRTFNAPNSLTVGTAEPHSDASLRIFPNPTSGHVTLRSDQPLGLLRVTDATGKQVFFSDADASSTSLTLDLTALPDGVYFLKAGQRLARSLSMKK